MTPSIDNFIDAIKNSTFLKEFFTPDVYNQDKGISVETFSDKERFFINRTRNHIGLVKKAAEKIVNAYPEYKELLSNVELHDLTKFQEPERTPYIELTWNKFKGIKDADARTTEATLHHIVNNPHHPEYWNPGKASLDPNDRDASVKCLDAVAMPDIAVAEMIADWQAMSEELKTNTAREWFNKKRNVRWKFSASQEALMDKLLQVFESGTQLQEGFDLFGRKKGTYFQCNNFSWRPILEYLAEECSDILSEKQLQGMQFNDGVYVKKEQATVIGTRVLEMLSTKYKDPFKRQKDKEANFINKQWKEFAEFCLASDGFQVN